MVVKPPKCPAFALARVGRWLGSAPASSPAAATARLERAYLLQSARHVPKEKGRPARPLRVRSLTRLWSRCDGRCRRPRAAHAI